MQKSIILLLSAMIFLGCQNEQNPKNQPQEQSTTSITIKKGDKTAQNRADNWVVYDIDGAKNIKFGVGESNQTTKSIGAIALTRAPLQSINKALLKGQLSKNFITKCSACHDDYANGIIGPSLLDKSNEQIYNMIIAYRTKTKTNILMSDLVKAMSDKEIKDIANEISEFNKQFRSQK
ncbi:monoheme c-type cytochrome [Campylobacter porcelli]|nr:monoheme c-type cytochrome [Campylobacter sp. RM6137]